MSTKLLSTIKAQGIPLYLLAAKIHTVTDGKVKLPPSMLGQIVHGRMIPTTGQRIGIASALGVSVDELFPRETE